MQNHTPADGADSESHDLVDGPESESAGAAASNTIPITSDTSISHSQILIPNSQVHNIVRTLWLYAQWTYPQLHEALGISLSTLQRIVNDNHPPTTHTENQHLNVNNELSNTSRHSIVNAETQQRLIATATASAHHRRLPYMQIAKLAGIKLSKATLKKVFKSAGYNRLVARKKGFLLTSAKEKRHAWGERFRDWGQQDWGDVIWTDECAFSVGDICGTTWVTRKAGEQYEEDCLVPHFARQTTIMVWGAIYRDQKRPLVV